MIKKAKRIIHIRSGGIVMTKINKNNIIGLTREKKNIFKSLVGSASSKNIDFNKVREECKYGQN